VEQKESRALTSSGQEPSREVAAAEQELQDLRNSCALKDQKILEMQKSDASASRLKREIRELAEVLHQKRKELSYAHAERARLQQAVNGNQRTPMHQEPRDLVESSGTALTNDSDGRTQDRINSLQDENEQLRQRIALVHAQSERRNDPGNLGLPVSSPQHCAASREGSYDSRSFRRPEGNMSGYGNATSPAAANGTMGGSRYPTIPGALGGNLAMIAGNNAIPVDDPQRPLVNSSMDHNTASSLGQVPLQGVGMVEGASGVARVLLQRLGSSVYHQQGRRQQQNPGHPQMAQAPQLAQPGGGQ
jgi:hypothetical protein